jgi:DNA-binding LacI/PurR family transcriptional regulator
MAKRKLVSIKDIAKEAGVSISSVSFALNDPERVGADTRRHILRIARELGYTRVKKLRKRGYIGLVADDYYNLLFGEFYNWVVFGILEELKKRGVNVLVESTGKDPEYFPRMITKSMVDGVLFLGKSSRDLIYIAQQKNIPLVMVGHPIPEIELHAIVPDGRSGAFQAVNHLIELGHKRIAMIIGEPMYDPITAERVEGFRFALTKAGLSAKKEYIAEADFGKPETALKATNKLLELPDPPTAIFCASDSLAFRAYKAIKEKGLKIPKDISVVGFDDIAAPEYAELPKPDLTTVRVDRKEMGKSSVEILFEVIQNPARTAYRYTLPVQLAVKKSSGPPRKR